jgi:hypothetical protein
VEIEINGFLTYDRQVVKIGRRPASTASSEADLGKPKIIKHPWWIKINRLPVIAA